MPDKKEYDKEYEKRFNEKPLDQAYNSPASKLRRMERKMTPKIKQKVKDMEDKVKKSLENADNSLGRDTMGYKKGGKVKRMSCPVDGMAKRGKTKVRRKGR